MSLDKVFDFLARPFKGAIDAEMTIWRHKVANEDSCGGASCRVKDDDDDPDDDEYDDILDDDDDEDNDPKDE